MNSEFWSCKHTWKNSANNTKWCLIGCAIGDFGTDRKSVVQGKSVDLGGRRIIKKKTKKQKKNKGVKDRKSTRV